MMPYGAVCGRTGASRTIKDKRRQPCRAGWSLKPAPRRTFPKTQVLGRAIPKACSETRRRRRHHNRPGHGTSESDDPTCPAPRRRSPGPSILNTRDGGRRSRDYPRH